MTRVRRAAFGLTVALGVFAGVELALAAVEAVGGRSLRVDPLPGAAPIDVLCASGPDHWVLCPDQGAAYERVRPERFSRTPDRPRVVVIGESFVYGLGLDSGAALPAQLGAALGPTVEVLNFGRCGTYAGRLLPVVGAAIPARADLVVLAIGNNEHTMTTFFTGPAARHPLLAWRLLSALGQWRLFGLVARLSGAGAPAVESIDAPPLRLDDPVDQAVYSARRRPPDLRLFPDGLAGREVTRRLEEEQRLKEQIFAGHLRRMVRGLRGAGVEVVLATLPWDLRARPTLSGTLAADEAPVRAAHAALRAAPDAPDGPVTRAAIDALLTADPSVAAGWAARGDAAFAAGDSAAAVDAWRRAADHDLVPDATPRINAEIAAVAAAEGVPLVGLHALSDTAVGDPGRLWMDKVHTNAEGARVLAAALAPAVAAALTDAP